MKKYLVLIQWILCLSIISSQTVNIKIIETTDEHGKIFPYNFRSGQYSNGSLAQINSYLNVERGKKDQEVILLSNGDILQGTPVVYYYNFEDKINRHPYAEVMNYMNYDAATVGNHDIETGHNVYDKFRKELNFPWLAANAVNSNTKEPYFQPYSIIKKKGIKIAVLGLITPAIPKWLPSILWEGIYFEDMIESAHKWIKIIKKKENPDLVVGLFHAGVDYNYSGENANTPFNENASALIAEQVEGFDIIFVGHDHHGWNYTTNNPNNKPVYILGATSGCRNVSVADVRLKFDENKNAWNKTIAPSIIEMKDFNPDKLFLEKFKDYYNQTEKYVSKPIATLTKTIESKFALFGDSEFVDLIHSIQLELTGADISFAAPLSFNTKINKGELTVGDMFNLYRYENFLFTMELSGKEVIDYLEYSYSLWLNKMKDDSDNLLLFNKDKNNKVKLSKRTNRPELKSRYYNFDSAAGIEYIVDVSKNDGNRINIKKFSNGKEFSLDRMYSVAINSYRGNGGGGHLTEGSGISKNNLASRVKSSTDKDLRYYFIKWFEKKKSVTPTKLNNWKIVPNKFWTKGKKKDSKLLFGEEL